MYLPCRDPYKIYVKMHNDNAFIYSLSLQCINFNPELSSGQSCYNLKFSSLDESIKNLVDNDSYFIKDEITDFKDEQIEELKLENIIKQSIEFDRELNSFGLLNNQTSSNFVLFLF